MNEAVTIEPGPAGDRLIGRKTGPIGEIIFNNPAKHNAVSLDMWQACDDLLKAFADDDEIRAVVVSGAGKKAFVSGADISKFESERATKEAVEHYGRTSTAACNRLYDFPKPTIAKIRGYCIGGGMNIAICCDIRICEERSTYAIPAAKLGLGYGHGGVKRLSDVVGVSRAMEFFFTARQFNAQEAYAMGLVNHVLPMHLLDAYVDDYTSRIAENAPMTIGTIKAAARQITTPESRQDLESVAAMVQACFDSEDYVEGRRAFMEKRKPRFMGR